MPRRRRHEEPENHERWLVSYADFITLLFAFFVVMYSVSSVNEGKYRVLADSMVATFKDPKRSLEPIQIGELVRSPELDTVAIRSMPVALEIGAPGDLEGGPQNAEPVAGEAAPEVTDAAARDDAERPREPDPAAVADDPGDPEPDPEAQDDGAPMADIDEMAARVQAAMAPLIDDEVVSVRRMDSWLEVEFNTSILFESGAALLSGNAVSLLGDVADLLKSFPNPIQVEGFTDDVPIRTPQFPSNWELSAARAASVVHLFTKVGIRPERMVAIGYGEFRPVSENATDAGRRRNRRVVLVIPAAEDARRVLDLDRLSASTDAAPEGG